VANTRATPVLIEKYGRDVVIVMSVEEYERLSLLAEGAANAKEEVWRYQSVSRKPLARAEIDRLAKNARRLRRDRCDRHKLLT
jgi:PHD/YefM family antitoxin component YafN of YafNO toxin-antitoxin module